ncbi:hypothetical protein [Sphingosinicella sp. BN140058]|uniref:hypothetical protein n=1 Tax=Sphingosinicella sp. BN140058 TaxID=1892855 RepID=UPI001012B661|nr:hypothetical protein [Sphingosinicella sp. BN140058]QAY80320.1 hypothetical protein ETR14_27135 [Sphingosinicella sp. BN140058]
MQAYDWDGFLKQVSQNDTRAYMMVSCDYVAAELCWGRAERVFRAGLTGEALDKLIGSGAALVIFDDIESAQASYVALQSAAESFHDIGFASMVFYQGHSLLAFAQNREQALTTSEYGSVAYM